MKIGIVTHALINNYGGILQNYAMQFVLKDLGHEVLTIDRMVKVPLLVKIKSIIKRFLQRLVGKNLRVRAWTKKSEFNIINKNTRGFVREYISTTTEVLEEKQLGLIQSSYRFDGYVVGSDQVWRRNSNGNGVEFLNFVSDRDDITKVAYAASFGIDYWNYSSIETQKYSELAKLFDSISVREKSGIDLCETYLGVEAQEMVDPTLLLDKEDYSRLVFNAKIEQSAGDLFVYVLDRSEENTNIIHSINSHLSLVPFEIMPEQNFMLELPKGEKFDILKCQFPKVEKWLRAFIDAKFVVTDSFHGTVFAIIFNKPFISIQNSKRGSTRFHSLLTTFGLQDRLVTDINAVTPELIFSEIDFLKIEEKRKELIKDAKAFLSKSF